MNADRYFSSLTERYYADGVKPPKAGYCGSVVVCTMCKLEIVDWISDWAEFAVDSVLLGKAFTHTCTLSAEEWK